jgi:hypothetical protein
MTLPPIIRNQATPSAAPISRTAFRHKLATIAVIGTLLPLAVLALLYLLAPLPMTAATMDILRTANRFAGTVVLLHWGVTLAVWAVSHVVMPAPARNAGWQNVKQVRRVKA